MEGGTKVSSHALVRCSKDTSCGKWWSLSCGWSQLDEEIEIYEHDRGIQISKDDGSLHRDDIAPDVIDCDVVDEQIN